MRAYRIGSTGSRVGTGKGRRVEEANRIQCHSAHVFTPVGKESDQIRKNCHGGSNDASEGPSHANIANEGEKHDVP
jgi:hypothetical protein